MPSSQDKIDPLQGNINDIQVEISDIDSNIAEANAKVDGFDAKAAKAFADKKTYEARWKQADFYSKQAFKVKDKLSAKKRKVCGQAFYDGVCKEYVGWRNEVNAWIKKFNESKQRQIDAINDSSAWSDTVVSLEKEKTTKENEIAAIQKQINAIIASDPELIQKGLDADVKIKKLDTENQRKIIILGVVFVLVLILGFAIIKRL